MIIITLVLLFQGVFSQSITVTPNTTSIDNLEGANITIEYKIDPGRVANWAVEMNFGNSPHAFFIHSGGQSYKQLDECINCNVTYNNLNTTFTLHLYNVTMDNNNGTYKFELKNVHNVTHRINVHVRALPVLSTSDVSGLEFTNLTLKCSINTDWFDKMWWTTSNGSIISSCNRSHGHDFQTCLAVISYVTRESQDVYICHAENPPHYIINKTINLDIVYGPKNSTQLLITTGIESNLSASNITVKEGDVLNLSCAANCNPNCNYTWNNNNGNGSYLTIKADRKTEYITCTTENQHGVYNASVKVNVLYSSEISNFTTLNGKTTVNETGKITIKCSAVGNPKPNIIWSMEGTNRSYKKEQCSKYKPTLKSEGSHCEHLLEDLDCFGTGNYTCTSVNGIGNTSDSKTLSIIVNCKPKILQPKKKLVKVYDNLKTFNVCFTGFPVPNVTLHVANNTNIINNDIFTISNVHTINLMVLLNNSESGVKTGNYRLEMWNKLGKDYLDIQLICYKQHGSGGLEMIIAVAAACLILGLCFLIGVFGIRRKQIKKQTTEERSTDVQLRVPRGYDGSYRDNSLYISSGPTLTNNGDSARNVNNHRQEAAGTTTSDGGYRDNTLYVPCTTEQLQKLNAEKKSNMKEPETSKRDKKKEEHCHGDDEDYQYSYVNLPENFITKEGKHKVGNHKSKENKTSQGKKNEDTQNKRLISKRKNDMRIDEHNNMLEKSPEYEQEIEAKSNNSMDEYCAETTVPRIPPKTALAFQADYSL